MSTQADGPVVHDPYSLPSDDNVNPYAFCVDLNGEWFLQKGKMIAYYGRIDFHGVGHGPLDRLISANFHSPLHAADWVVAQGQGKMLLADRAFDVNSFDLDNGNLTIRAANLLAFQPGLALKQSIVPGFLTLIGTGRFVAASNGAVVFVEPPIRVDPQALVGWADCPTPCHHYDHTYMRGALGMARAWRLDQAWRIAGRARRQHDVGRKRRVEAAERVGLDVLALGAVLLHEIGARHAGFKIGREGETVHAGAGLQSHRLERRPGIAHIGAQPLLGTGRGIRRHDVDHLQLQRLRRRQADRFAHGAFGPLGIASAQLGQAADVGRGILHHSVEPFGVAGQDHDGRAGGVRRLHHRQPHPAAASSDHHDLVAQIDRHGRVVPAGHASSPLEGAFSSVARRTRRA